MTNAVASEAYSYTESVSMNSTGFGDVDIAFQHSRQLGPGAFLPASCMPIRDLTVLHVCSPTVVTSEHSPTSHPYPPHSRRGTSQEHDFMALQLSATMFRTDAFCLFSGSRSIRLQEQNGNPIVESFVPYFHRGERVYGGEIKLNHKAELCRQYTVFFSLGGCEKANSFAWDRLGVEFKGTIIACARTIPQRDSVSQSGCVYRSVDAACDRVGLLTAQGGFFNLLLLLLVLTCIQLSCAQDLFYEEILGHQHLPGIRIFEASKPGRTWNST